MHSIERQNHKTVHLEGQTGWTMMRLGRCPGWSESSQGAQVILLVLSCSGSIVLVDSHKIALTYHTCVSLTIISFAMVIIGTKTLRDVNIQLPTTAQCRQGDCGQVCYCCTWRLTWYNMRLTLMSDTEPYLSRGRPSWMHVITKGQRLYGTLISLQIPSEFKIGSYLLPRVTGWKFHRSLFNLTTGNSFPFVLPCPVIMLIDKDCDVWVFIILWLDMELQCEGCQDPALWAAVCTLSLLLHVLKAAMAMIISPKLLAASDIVNTDIIICGFVSVHGVETVLLLRELDHLLWCLFVMALP